MAEHVLCHQQSLLFAALQSNAHAEFSCLSTHTAGLFHSLLDQQQSSVLQLFLFDCFLLGVTEVFLLSSFSLSLYVYVYVCKHLFSLILPSLSFLPSHHPCRASDEVFDGDSVLSLLLNAQRSSASLCCPGAVQEGLEVPQ